MNMKMLPLWICSSLLFQDALGAPNAPGPSPSLGAPSTVPHHTPEHSVLEHTIDWALSEFERTLDKTKSAQLKSTLHTILHQYEQRIEALEHTLETYDTVAKETIGVLDNMTAALAACRAQSDTSEATEYKTSKEASKGVKLGKRYDQLYQSYLTLKPQFKDALSVLQKRFPGFKYNPKKIAGLAQQFESWAKSNLNSSATPPSTPSTS